MRDAGLDFQPGGLRSLRDMLNILFGGFYHCLRTTSIEGERANLRPENEPAADDFLAEVEKCVQGLQGFCSEFGLKESGKRVKRVLGGLKSKPRYNDLTHQLRTLVEVIEDEGGDHYIYHIAASKGSGVYADIKNLWMPVINKFPSADREILAANICYAVDQDTACIFHLMRSAEIGLRVLARERRVKIPRKPLDWANWQDIITHIKIAVDKIGKRRPGPAKDAALAFYQGALGEFEAFKDVYRNNVMHVRMFYDEHQSASALVHVREFMTRLAARLDEREKKQIKWGLR